MSEKSDTTPPRKRKTKEERLEAIVAESIALFREDAGPPRSPPDLLADPAHKDDSGENFYRKRGEWLRLIRRPTTSRK